MDLEFKKKIEEAINEKIDKNKKYIFDFSLGNTKFFEDLISDERLIKYLKYINYIRLNEIINMDKIEFMIKYSGYRNENDKLILNFDLLKINREKIFSLEVKTNITILNSCLINKEWRSKNHFLEQYEKIVDLIKSWEKEPTNLIPNIISLDREIVVEKPLRALFEEIIKKELNMEFSEIFLKELWIHALQNDRLGLYVNEILSLYKFFGQENIVLNFNNLCIKKQETPDFIVNFNGNEKIAIEVARLYSSWNQNINKNKDKQHLDKNIIREQCLDLYNIKIENICWPKNDAKVGVESLKPAKDAIQKHFFGKGEDFDKLSEYIKNSDAKKIIYIFPLYIDLEDEKNSVKEDIEEYIKKAKDKIDFKKITIDYVFV